MSLSRLTPPRRLKVSDQIAGLLRREILSDGFPPGERLPAERELAERLGTNRNTLREAIRLLQAQGLVRAEQGNGVVVQDFRRQGELPLIPHFLVEGARPDERVQALRDLLPVRRFFAAQAAALATERARGEQLTALEEVVGRQQALLNEEEPDAVLLTRNDVALYEALVEASGSLVARLVSNTITAIYRAIMELFPGLWFTPAGYDTYLSGLCQAVASGDPERARQHVLHHFDAVDEVLDALLAGVGGELLAGLNPEGRR